MIFHQFKKNDKIWDTFYNNNSLGIRIPQNFKILKRCVSISNQSLKATYRRKIYKYG